MHRLLEKPEIIGTCWVEFNVSGNRDTYEHWQASSRYASLDAMYGVYDVFSICLEKFDLYCPMFIDSKNATELSKMLDGFSSANPAHCARRFAEELSAFLCESIAKEKPIWMLGA